jgi:glutaredoxin
MKKRLIVFTLNGCGTCDRFKEKLKMESIPFTEYEVGDNEDMWEQVVLQTKSEYVPTFLIKDEDKDEGMVFCPITDFNDEEDAMKIVKKHF